MWTPASFRANVLVLQRMHATPPRERCWRSTFAVLAFLCVLLSSITLFGVGDYSPLEQFSVITSVDVPFRIPRPQSYKARMKNVKSSKISKMEDRFKNYSATTNGTRNQSQKMCSDIFSIGKIRPTMTPMAKSIVSYLRRVKANPKERRFLRHEPYFILGDMVPLIFNVTTTSDNVTKVNYNKVWRMEQVAGLFPHLSCRLRDYSTAMLKQCIVNRRKRGKGTKLLFMGDSRVRQFIEVFLDVFRDLDFEVHTQEGDVLPLHEFLGPDVEALWAKYKRRFVAKCKQTPDLELEFYWTTIFDLKVHTVNVFEPGINSNWTALLEQMRREDVEKGRHNNTHAIFQKYLTEMNLTEPVNSQNQTRNISLKKTFNTTNAETYSEQFSDVNFNNISSTSLENASNTGVKTSNNLVEPRKQVKFKSKPLERLKKFLDLASTEVPDLVILGSDVWGLDNSDPILRVFDDITLRQVAQLRPLLLRLSAVTQLVWVMPTTVKDHMYRSSEISVLLTNTFMRNIEWIASAQVQLMAQGITVWDSFFPLTHASLTDCLESFRHGNIKLPNHPRLELTRSWFCGDRVHNSNEAFVVAAQMMVNQLCNEYMPHQGYCCEV